MTEIEMLEQLEEMLGFGSIMSLLSALPSLMVSLAAYLATAYGLYTVAKRRGIRKPWLAWIPVVNAWTLGAISDHYRLMTEGKKKTRRKILVSTNVAMTVLSILLIVVCIVMLVGLLAGMGSDMVEIPENTLTAAGTILASVILLGFPIIVLAIVYAVFYYMALYDVYKSCEPNNAVLYLVLSIVISYCQPIFMVLCCKKDGGMYAAQPQAEIPAAPVELWEQDQE